jgi:SAM-dependent methyltransferase
MSELESDVARHYAREGIEGMIIEGLRALGKDPDAITPADLSAVDEFHLGWGPQTAQFAQRLELAPEMHVLEVGSGIGGPARHFAHACGCRVTGIDLTPDFVAVARSLTGRVGLADLVGFVEGSALDMPFDAASFDAATLIHVGMNIADKTQLFAEVRRVLRPGARFGLYEVMRVGDGEIPMPMPWAGSAATNFVETPEVYVELLQGAGFAPASPVDRTRFVHELWAKMQTAAAAAGGPPPLGLHILVGPAGPERFRNTFAALAAGVLAPVEIVAEAV